MTSQDSGWLAGGGPGGRWVLAPDALVVPRGADELQVGRGARALVLSDEPGGASLLQRLATTGAEWRPGERDWWWRRLLDRGLLVPVDELTAELRRAADPAAVSAAYATLGARGTDALDARRHAHLVVAGATGWVEVAADLARRSGLRVTCVDHRAGHRVKERGVDERGDAWLVAGGGTDQRDLTDSLLRAEVPHLPVRLGPRAAVRVGPFVAPGSSPCLRCVEASVADRDPTAGLVALRYARAEAVAALPGVGSLHAGAPLPEDPATVHLGLAWAVRDLLTWVEGDLPTTWATTVDLDRELVATRTGWVRHPRCGCAWDLAGGAA
jgi:hypothetical protein